jgi:hypothetical protein
LTIAFLRYSFQLSPDVADSVTYVIVGDKEEAWS